MDDYLQRSSIVKSRENGLRERKGTDGRREVALERTKRGELLRKTPRGTKRME